jgi:hypothetical protein
VTYFRVQAHKKIPLTSHNVSLQFILYRQQSDIWTENHSCYEENIRAIFTVSLFNFDPGVVFHKNDVTQLYIIIIILLLLTLCVVWPETFSRADLYINLVSDWLWNIKYRSDDVTINEKQQFSDRTSWMMTSHKNWDN